MQYACFRQKKVYGNWKYKMKINNDNVHNSWEFSFGILNAFVVFCNNHIISILTEILFKINFIDSCTVALYKY